MPVDSVLAVTARGRLRLHRSERAGCWVIAGTRLHLTAHADGTLQPVGTTEDTSAWVQRNDLGDVRFRSSRKALDIISAAHAADPLPAGGADDALKLTRVTDGVFALPGGGMQIRRCAQGWQLWVLRDDATWRRCDMTYRTLRLARVGLADDTARDVLQTILGSG